VAQAELGCKDIQDELKRLEAQVGFLKELLDDPELTPQQKGQIRAQIRAIGVEIAGAKDRLRECLSSKLTIAGVELTQATQYFDINGQGSGFDQDNSVPLVSQRPLIVRVYPNRKSSGGSFPPIERPVRVTGRLRYERISPSTKSFPSLAPMNGSVVGRSVFTIDRGEPEHTLNFRIPPTDCQGVLRLTVEIFEDGPVVAPLVSAGNGSVITSTEVSAPSDSLTVLARFERVPAFRVRTVLIHYTGSDLNIEAPSGLEFAKDFQYVLSTFPIGRVEFGDCVEAEFDGDLTQPIQGSGCGQGWTELLDMLEDFRDGGDPDDIYVALLPKGVPTNGVLGCGGRGGLAATYVGLPTTLAQEIGHALRRMHAPCGGAPNPDPNYPTYGSYSSGSIGEFGFDTSKSVTFDPATSEDFMSYCAPRWISPYTYIGIRNELQDRFGARAAAREEGRAEPQEFLFLKFRMNRDGTVRLRPSFVRTGLPPVTPGDATSVTCELVGSGDEVLAFQRCHLSDPYQDPHGPHLDFNEALRWSEDAQKLVFRRDGEVVETIDVEQAAPTLEVAPPGITARTANVEWRAHHPDRELDYVMEFSNDDGRTWRTVGRCRGERRCEVDQRRLPGGDRCRFRVLASSGVRTAVAESETFALSVKPRRAHILTPEPGTEVFAGTPVVLLGGGFSPDHGLSDPDDVVWTSNIDGVVGRGHEVVASDLTAGPHIITVSVPDGAGAVAVSETTILVEEDARVRGSIVTGAR
jgi:hypothetical protein